MFIAAASLTIVKIWCPNNRILPFEIAWMDFGGGIMLSELYQTGKDK